MNFEFMVHNPHYPKDRNKAVVLSPAQLDAVNPYLCDCLNNRKKPDEDRMLQILQEAGLGIAFDFPPYTVEMKVDRRSVESLGRDLKGFGFVVPSPLLENDGHFPGARDTNYAFGLFILNRVSVALKA